jgi:hypothetical protein
MMSISRAWLAAAAAVALSVVTVTGEARAQEGEAYVEEGYAAPAADVPFTYHELEQIAVKRTYSGALLVVVGGLVAIAGVALYANEFMVGDQREGNSDAKTAACEVQLKLATVATVGGAALMGMGAGVLGRGYQLKILARVLEVEGAHPAWWDWYMEARTMRKAGNMLSVMGAIMTTMGVGLLPYDVCQERFCEGCGLQTRYQTVLGAGLVTFGGLFVAVGLAMAITGYVRQHRVIKGRHLPAPPRVQLGLGPGGLALTW